MDVGELFVRVRPDTAGFEEEAEPGVQGAGTSLGKLFVAAFAAIGIGDLIKRSVDAAVQQQQQFAVLNKTISNAGAANEVHGQSIDNLVKQQAALKGFSVGDVTSALGKLESVTRNSAEAFKLLGDAEDLSRGTGKNLTTSALGVEKAFEGSGTSLARYGIIIKPVVADVEALAKAHAAAADAGVVFTAQQNAAYAIQVKNATLQDKVLTGQEAIAAIQARFGGEASTFANTAAGQWDRLKVSVDELEVSIGTELLPTITAGIGDLTKWANELADSTTVQHDAAIAGQDFSTVLHDIEGAAQVVAPVLGQVAKYAYDVVQAIGAPEILIAVATYKALGIATNVVAGAQAFYARAVAATSVTETANTAAITENTTARTLNTAATLSWVDAAGAVNVANGELAASETAVGVAGEEAAAGGLGDFLAGAGSLGLGAAGGPVGIAVLGLAGLAAAIYHVSTEEGAWQSANTATKSSLQGLTGAIQQQDDAVGKLARDAAAANVAAEYEKVTTAVEKLGTAATGSTLPTAHTLGPGSIVPGATAANLAVQSATIERQRLALQTGQNVEAEQKFIDALGQQALALGKSNPLLTHNLDLIGELASVIKKVPSEVDIQLLINNKDPNASLQDILSGITGFTKSLTDLFAPAVQSQLTAGGPLQAGADAILKDLKTGRSGATLTEAAQLAIEQLREGIANASQQQQDLNQQMQDAVQQGAISVEQSVQQAQQNFITIGQGIATDIGTYIDVPLTLTGDALQLQADRIAAIQQNLVTRFAGENALLDQETNRISLRATQLTLHEQTASVELPGGKALSSNPAQALKELEAAKARATPAGKFALQQLIDTYQGDVIAVKKAQEAIVTGDLNVKEAQKSADNAGKQAHLKVLQDMATDEKTAATNSINDWAAEWEQKKITLTKFNADVATLIKGDIGKLGNVAKVPGGELIEAQLRGSLLGLGQQALAIQQGPQQPGAGFLPTIEHPLTALQNEQKQIASIAHSDATNQTTIQTDMRNILKQIYGAQKDTAGLSSLARATPATLRAEYRAALAGLPGG